MFSAANTLRLVLFVPTVIGRVMLPTLNSLQYDADRTKFAKAFRANIALTSSITALLALTLGLLRHPLLSLFGRDFHDITGATPILLIAAVVEAAACSFYQALFVYGKMWRQVWIISVWSLLLVAVEANGIGTGALRLSIAYLSAWCFSLLAYSCSAYSNSSDKPSYHPVQPICNLSQSHNSVS